MKISCQECTRGKYGDQLKSTTEPEGCQPCAKGRYSNNDGYGYTYTTSAVLPCQACDAGKWSSTEGAYQKSVCIYCNVGKYSSTPAANSSDACLDCDQGKFLTAVGSSQATDCENCVPGQVQNKPGQAYCLPCMPGKNQVSPGQHECIDCIKDHYSVDGITCHACRQGRFSTSGSSRCKPCDLGMKTVSSNNLAVPDDYICEICPKGTFSWTLHKENQLVRTVLRASIPIWKNKINVSHVMLVDFSSIREERRWILVNHANQVVMFQQ